MVEGLEQKLGVSMPDLESPEAKDFLLDLVSALLLRCSCHLQPAHLQCWARDSWPATARLGLRMPGTVCEPPGCVHALSNEVLQLGQAARSALRTAFHTATGS
jgi:hypothetical protein